MDLNSLGSLAGLVSIAIHVVQSIIAAINHKKCKSRCCGKQVDSSLDITDTTPPARAVAPIDSTTT